MSVALLPQPNRALPLTRPQHPSIQELQIEGYALLAQIDALENASIWQCKKGIRMIEIGTYLNEDIFLNAGQSFLRRIGLTCTCVK